MPAPCTNSPPRSAALLWASAFVLMGLIVVQIGRIADRSGHHDRANAALPLALMSMGPGQSGAGSGVVSRVGDYTVMTFSGGNDDVLAVLDGRNETLFTYRVRNLNQFELLGKSALPELFTNAKRLGPGRK